MIFVVLTETLIKVPLGPGSSAGFLLLQNQKLQGRRDNTSGEGKLRWTWWQYCILMRVQSGKSAALTVSCTQPCFLSGEGVTSSLKVPGYKQSPEKWPKSCEGIALLAHPAEFCRKAQGPWQLPATPPPPPAYSFPVETEPLPQESGPRCTPHIVLEKG